MGREAWWFVIHRVSKSRTQPKQLSTHECYLNSHITKPPRWARECSLDLKPKQGTCLNSDLGAGLAALV